MQLMNTLNELAREGKINENASVKDGHSTIINASIDKVWGLIIDIQNWPKWNQVVKSVQVEEKIEEGTSFAWNLNGTKIKSQVQFLESAHTMSCTGKSKWIKSIFVWQLESDENQTIVTLNASMQGAFATLFKNHQKVYNDLIKWLSSLKKAAES